MDLPAAHAGLGYILARIIQDFMRLMRRTGLSGPQIHTLLYIYHAGECNLSEIGRLTGSSRPATSQLVERLVQLGWVERTEDPSDRRNKRLCLTRKSLELIQDSFSSNHFLVELMSSLPARQRDTVHKALGYLVKASREIQSSHKQKDGEHA